MSWTAQHGALLVVITASSGAFAAERVSTYHCFGACPQGASEINQIVVRESYTLSSNGITKFADWVAYRVTPESIGPSEGRSWETDNWLTPGETLTPKAYDGASSALNIDRGHQAPLASLSGTAFAEQTNILSNITPQASALNQGAWVRLEDQERRLAKRLNGPVFVLTGPLYERMMRPLPSGPAVQRVPSGYWKVVSLPDGRRTAFIFDQAATRRLDFCAGRVSLTYVQLRSRLRLFPVAGDGEPIALDKELGCTNARPASPAPDDIPLETTTR
jgi:endonuclease G